MMTPIIVALDVAHKDDALHIVDELDPKVCRLKVGKEMFTRLGPAWIKQLQDKGFEIFLDLKFHDIPTTVARATLACADLGVWMMNVHALGGERMMSAAKEALLKQGGHQPILIAVTMLTSLTAADLPSIGLTGAIEENVMRLAALAKESGLDGVVAAATECPALTQAFGQNFKLITPGIRIQSLSDDQARTMTPTQALAAGSHYLVIGRPITRSPHPGEILQSILNSISNAGLN